MLDRRRRVLRLDIHVPPDRQLLPVAVERDQDVHAIAIAGVRVRGRLPHRHPDHLLRRRHSLQRPRALLSLVRERRPPTATAHTPALDARRDAHRSRLRERIRDREHRRQQRVPREPRLLDLRRLDAPLDQHAVRRQRPRAAHEERQRERVVHAVRQEHPAETPQEHEHGRHRRRRRHLLLLLLLLLLRMRVLAAHGLERPEQLLARGPSVRVLFPGGRVVRAAVHAPRGLAGAVDESPETRVLDGLLLLGKVPFAPYDAAVAQDGTAIGPRELLLDP